MGIESLEFAAPFFDVLYLEHEMEYYVGERSLVFNLDAGSESSLWVCGIPLPALKGTILQNVLVQNARRTLIIRNCDKRSLEDKAFVQELKNTWRSLFQCSGQERHRSIPYYRSPKAILGDIQVNFCYADANARSGLHREHDGSFHEVHAQICGVGKMQMFLRQDTTSLYQEVIMAPSLVHDKFYDADGKYPWHQYHSITPVVYMPIEMSR